MTSYAEEIVMDAPEVDPHLGPLLQDVGFVMATRQRLDVLLGEAIASEESVFPVQELRALGGLAETAEKAQEALCRIHVATGQIRGTV